VSLRIGTGGAMRGDTHPEQADVQRQLEEERLFNERRAQQRG
jgi:hypothetical protein